MRPGSAPRIASPRAGGGQRCGSGARRRRLKAKRKSSPLPFPSVPPSVAGLKVFRVSRRDPRRFARLPRARGAHRTFPAPLFPVESRSAPPVVPRCPDGRETRRALASIAISESPPRRGHSLQYIRVAARGAFLAASMGMRAGPPRRAALSAGMRARGAAAPGSRPPTGTDFRFQELGVLPRSVPHRCGAFFHTARPASVRSPRFVPVSH